MATARRMMTQRAWVCSVLYAACERELDGLDWRYQTESDDDIEPLINVLGAQKSQSKRFAK